MACCFLYGPCAASPGGRRALPDSWLRGRGCSRGRLRSRKKIGERDVRPQEARARDWRPRPPGAGSRSPHNRRSACARRRAFQAAQKKWCARVKEPSSDGRPNSNRDNRRHGASLAAPCRDATKRSNAAWRCDGNMQSRRRAPSHSRAVKDPAQLSRSSRRKSR